MSGFSTLFIAVRFPAMIAAGGPFFRGFWQKVGALTWDLRSGTAQWCGDVFMHDDPAMLCSFFKHHRPAPVQVRCRALLAHKICPKRHRRPSQRPALVHPQVVVQSQFYAAIWIEERFLHTRPV